MSINENLNYIFTHNEQQDTDKLKHLLSTIENIFTDNNYTIHYQTIYDRCFEICCRLLSKDFYHMLNSLFTKIVKSYSNTIQTIIRNEDFIGYLVITYSFYKEKVTLLSDVLIYMENNRIKHSSNEYSITHMCIIKFVNMMLSESVRNKFIEAICNELKLVREAGYENTKNLLIMLNMFNDIKKYNAEPAFIDEVVQMFKADVGTYCTKVSELLPSYDIVNEEVEIIKYIDKVGFVLQNEEHLFINLEEKNVIISIIIEKLLVTKWDKLILKGVKLFIESGNKEKISLLFRLFSTFEDSRSLFYTSIQELLINLLKAKENVFVDKSNNKIKYFNFYQYVDEIHELRKKLNNILLVACGNSTKVEHIIKLNFEKLVNKYECFLENFVKILHDEIKICIKNKNNSKIREYIETFLGVYKLFSDKDVFEFEYRKYLEKRLIRNASMLKETEYELYEILKKESGANHVVKIKTMLDDIENSKYTNDDFRKHCYRLDNGVNTIDFIVKILSSDSWPLEGVNYKTNHADTINLPTILDNYVTRFTNFYYEKFGKRQIIWVHEFSWAVVTFKAHKHYELIVSSYQMTILCCFNSRRKYILKDICTQMGIAISDPIKYKTFISYLIPLIKAHILILDNNKPVDKITQDDIVSLNEFYENEQFRINLNYKYEIVKEERKEKEISHFILEDRKYQIDAVIIKLLKQQKKISYDSLKGQVCQVVRSYFTPDSAIIDTRLENLLNRNLISKDPYNIDVYIYSI
jgi:cullin-4